MVHGERTRGINTVSWCTVEKRNDAGKDANPQHQSFYGAASAKSWGGVFIGGVRTSCVRADNLAATAG